MRREVIIYGVVILFVLGSLGYASAMVDITITLPHPGPWPTPGPRPWPTPVPPHPTWTTSTTVTTTEASGNYNTMCGFELFFWKVYSDTVFSENYVVLRKAFGCTPIRVSPSDKTDSMLVSYYLYLYSHTGDVYRYLAMRDYPIVVRVNSDVPSPGFDPILYAKFEKYLNGKRVTSKNQSKESVMCIGAPGSVGGR